MTLHSLLPLLAILLGLLFSPLTFSSQQLSWNDLGFNVHPEEDPFFGLGLEEKQSLETVLQLSQLSESGADIEAALLDQDRQARIALRKSGLDAEQLIRKEKSLREKLVIQGSAVRKELDGADILIPGYALPLEYEGAQVVEFLLVPYAGACIHVPPPPPNQIIRVRTRQGFALDHLFTPVWVSGVLTVETSRQVVELSDGNSEFDVGYTMSASAVELYK